MASKFKQNITNTKETITSVFDITTTRPVAILMVVVGIAVFGWISYQQLSLNLMPEMTYPTLTVRTEYPGTAPQEVETTVSRPIEQALGVVNNLSNISSISKPGVSDVILEFSWDTDMNTAVQDIREKLDPVFLPEDAEKPFILRYDPTLEPIMRFGLFGGKDLFFLRRIAEDELKNELEQVPGVAAVKIKGGLEDEILVEISEKQMALMAIDIGLVNTRLAQENINLAGGTLKDGQTEYLVRTLNEFKNVNEIREIVIGTFNGVQVKIKDIGRVSKTHKEREIITKINGKESVEIEIYKEADANIVKVAESVRERIFGTPQQQAFVARMAEREQSGSEKGPAEKAGNESKSGKQNGEEGKKKQQREYAAQKQMEREMTTFLAYNLPEATSMELLTDQSRFIQSSVDEVENTAIAGGILAILVLFLFLRNMKSTVIIGVSIPTSIVATFAAMKIFDVSLNIMSLGGLALGVGMLVDNSIVVLESIFRCREEGDSLTAAAVRGTKEVGSAVLASTLTTICVFFPIVFVEGVAGQVFGDMALVVVFSLLSSLMVALFFIPMLSSRSVDTQTGLGSQLMKMDLLRFRATERVGRVASEKTTSSEYWSLFLQIPMVVVDFFVKSAFILVSLVFVVIKGVILIPTGLAAFFPIAGVSGWSAQNRFWPSESGAPFERVWNQILSFKAFTNLSQSLRSYLSKTGDASIVRGIFRYGGLLPAALYFLFRFLFHMAFAITGKALFLFVLLLAVLVITFASLLAAVLLPVLIPVVFVPFEFSMRKISAGYPLLLRWSLDRKLGVILSALVPFVFCWLVLIPQLGSELIPQVAQGEFNVELQFDVGTPLEQTEKYVRDIENGILKLDGVSKVATRVGVEKSADASTDEGEHTAKITVTLFKSTDSGQPVRKQKELPVDEPQSLNVRSKPQIVRTGVQLPLQEEPAAVKKPIVVDEKSVIARIRELLRNIPGLKEKISYPVLFSFKTPIEVIIKGFNLEELKKISRYVETQMANIEGLQDVKSNIQRGNPEIQIRYHRDLLSKYGLNIRDVAEIVRNKVQGNVATEFKDQDRKTDILVRVNQEDRESVEDLKKLIVNPGEEIAIPLSMVSTIIVDEGPSEIRRIDQQRSALISANLSNIDLKTATARIEQILEKVQMPVDFVYEVAGQNQEMKVSIDSLIFALFLAIFLVYIVMASQFESLVHPFVIMFSIPLAIIGVVAVLYLAGIPLSIVVFIGIIILAGIVVNNAIVLIDYVNLLRSKGMEKTEAVIQAAGVRLRPILMTAMTTILGLLPMAVGFGDGAEIRTPMAVTVIAGMISASALTLIVIPVIYSLIDRKA